MNKLIVAPEVISFFKNNCASITADKDYFFLPAWISLIDETHMEVHPLGKLPAILVSAIEGFRESGFKPIMETKLTSEKEEVKTLLSEATEALESAKAQLIFINKNYFPQSPIRSSQVTLSHIESVLVKIKG